MTNLISISALIVAEILAICLYDVAAFQKCDFQVDQELDAGSAVVLRHHCLLDDGEHISWARLVHETLGLVAELTSKASDGTSRSSVQLRNLNWCDYDFEEFSFEAMRLTNVSARAGGNFIVQLNVTNSSDHTVATYTGAQRVRLTGSDEPKWKGFEQKYLGDDGSVQVVRSSQWRSGDITDLTQKLYHLHKGLNYENQPPSKVEYLGEMGYYKMQQQLNRLHLNNYINY